jgi:hypothetical protein
MGQCRNLTQHYKALLATSHINIYSVQRARNCSFVSLLNAGWSMALLTSVGNNES